MPLAAAGYLFGLAYLASFMSYRVARVLGSSTLDCENVDLPLTGKMP